MLSSGQEAARRAAITVYRLTARGLVFFPPPRVFVASQPKTGSHLLNTLLSHLPKMMFSGLHLSQDDFVYVPTPEAIRVAKGRTETNWSGLERVLARIRNGQFVTAHFPARRECSDLLDRLAYRTIFLLRDPRDTVVSHAFYVTRSETNYLHYRYSQVLRNTEERIMASIRGFPPDEHGRGQRPLGPRLTAFVSWLDDPRVLPCRFESLVGAQGGGDAELQEQEIQSVTSHVGRSLTAKQVGELTQKIWSPRSSTFRKGQIGDWRNHFTEEHKEAFKEQAGQQLIDLGYEKTNDW